jgi:hypothetical protein
MDADALVRVIAMRSPVVAACGASVDVVITGRINRETPGVRQRQIDEQRQTARPIAAWLRARWSALEERRRHHPRRRSPCGTVCLVFAAALALTLSGAAGVGTAAAQRLAIDYVVTCVYYTETSGSCLATTYYDDGGSSHAFYVFWGNWYAQV